MQLSVPAIPASLSQIRAAVRRWLGWAGVGEEAGFKVLLAVGEAASNAVEHAYGPRPGSVSIEVARQAGELAVTVRDTGTWRAARGSNRGRGLGIMQHCADEVRVDSTSAGTEVHLLFRIEP
jgi:anti-sigma regulatory factor (Ser/Thr protein kinase)